jgi:hypothetical protein
MIKVDISTTIVLYVAAYLGLILIFAAWHMLRVRKMRKRK